MSSHVIINPGCINLCLPRQTVYPSRRPIDTLLHYKHRLAQAINRLSKSEPPPTSPNSISEENSFRNFTTSLRPVQSQPATRDTFKRASSRSFAHQMIGSRPPTSLHSESHYGPKPHSVHDARKSTSKDLTPEPTPKIAKCVIHLLTDFMQDQVLS